MPVSKKKRQERRRRERSKGRSIKKRKVDGNYKIMSPKKTSQKKWIVYSLKGCPYCTMAVDFLTRNKQPCEYKVFATLSDQQKEQVMEKINAAGKEGFSTYPRIVDSSGNFIGGYKDMVAKFNDVKKQPQPQPEPEQGVAY